MAVEVTLNNLRALVEHLGPRDAGDPRGDGSTPAHAKLEFSDATIGAAGPDSIKGVLAKVSYETGMKSETVEYWYLIAGSSVIKVR